jgi:ketosteroid isomerase-like protein
VSPYEIDSLLTDFAAAWDTRDLDGTIEFFAEEAEYFASVGSEPRERAQGRSAIKSLVKKMFSVDEDARTEVLQRLISDDTVAWTWLYTLPDGSQVRGCDFLKFKDGKIILKDAYRKTRPIRPQSITSQSYGELS